MSRVPPGKTPSGRQPTFRGAFQLDTFRGEIRARRWPRKRGKPKTLAEKARQDWFRAVQKAADYWPSQTLRAIHDATAGTPLLPRDIVTHIASGRAAYFELPDGRKIYPMLIKTQVSEALDSLGQTEGMLIIRGAQYWEAHPISALPIGPPSFIQTDPKASLVATAARASKGTAFIPRTDLDIERVTFEYQTGVTARNRISIYRLTAANAITEVVARSEEYTAPYTGWHTVHFAIEAQLLDGTRYGVTLETIGSGATPSIGQRYLTSGNHRFIGAPIDAGAVITMSKESPAVGDTFVSNADAYEFAMLARIQL